MTMGCQLSVLIGLRVAFLFRFTLEKKFIEPAHCLKKDAPMMTG